jgi:hypothetical protein
MKVITSQIYDFNFGKWYNHREAAREHKESKSKSALLLSLLFSCSFSVVQKILIIFEQNTLGLLCLNL